MQDLQETSPTLRKMHEGPPRSGVSAHLTPTKRKRKGTNHVLQSKCRICRKKTTYICSQCADKTGCHIAICHSKTNRTCFLQHLQKKHPSI